MDVRYSAGIELTESFAMWPGASVSGLYIAHPDSHYFGVGKVERYGGVDVRDIGWDTVRENVGVVLQHPVLFNASPTLSATLDSVPRLAMGLPFCDRPTS